MFDALVSPTYAARWNASIAFALLLHLVVIRLAIGSTSSRTAAMPAAHRDTIRLELARVEPDPPRASESPQASRDDVVPIAPLFPPNPIRDMKAPQLDFTYEGAPDSGMAAVQHGILETGATSDSSARVSPGLGADELPELIGELRPHYPAGLRRAGVSGSVQVQYVIGTEGRMDPRSVQVLSSTHPDFALAAVEALRGARFKPARRGGTPVPVLVRQNIFFRSR